jgi:hypothetical protein
MTEKEHPIPAGRDKRIKRQIVTKRIRNEKPEPNTQPWLVTYVEDQVVEHRFNLPVGEKPYIDENGWLQCRNVGTNAKHIRKVRIKRNGAAFYREG